MSSRRLDYTSSRLLIPNFPWPATAEPTVHSGKRTRRAVLNWEPAAPGGRCCRPPGSYLWPEGEVIGVDVDGLLRALYYHAHLCSGRLCGRYQTRPCLGPTASAKGFILGVAPFHLEMECERNSGGRDIDPTREGVARTRGQVRHVLADGVALLLARVRTRSR